MKDSYLIRKDQRYQGRNPPRKQEKVEVKIGKVRVIEYEKFLSDTEIPTIPESESSNKARESRRKPSPSSEIPTIPGS